MPTYDYECSECGNKFSVTKPMSEYKNREFCPKCKEVGIKILPRLGNFILKGSDWPGKDIKENRKTS